MHTLLHLRLHTGTHIHTYMCIGCREFRGTMLRNSAGDFKHLRPKFKTHLGFKRLARNRETRKACSGTFAKLAPQHGHAFLDAI